MMKDAELIADWLEKGKNVVFLTLGDPTVYSTYFIRPQTGGTDGI